ncbi:MAG: SDR family oxidoreductase [Acidobacteriota bacterium]|nr:SDR family oxidoreductase [Acidobacteriota bacterium]
MLITGSSKGIGLVTAVTLARGGHTVYATLRSVERVAELSEEYVPEGLPLHFSVMDVDSDESVTAGIAAVYAEAGSIDVLINNAGIERSGAIEDLPLSAFREVMETNYFGALRAIKAVLPHMRERRSGCILNVSSVAGRVTTSPLGPYAATKHALESISEALAQELKPFNVRVVILEPGIIDTPMANGIGIEPPPSLYPQQRRMAQYFAARLRNGTDPLVIADKIRSIIESGTWILRHPAGGGAENSIEGRKTTSDEDYIALQAADDDTWYRIMEERTGLKIRPESAESTE